MTDTITLEEFPYTPDSCQLFERIRNMPGAIFFDSAFPHSTMGRYDILTACPLELGIPQLRPGASELESRTFFSNLSELHHELYGGIQQVIQDIPFCGGVLGSLDYEAGYGLNKLPPHAASLSTPSSQLHAYEWAIVQDHLLGKAVLATLPGMSRGLREDIRLRLRCSVASVDETFQLRKVFHSNFTQQEYQQAFHAILDYIHAGDCYQVNLAQRFTAAYKGDPWSAYKVLREVAAAPFSAFATREDDAVVMSLSPERFTSVHGQHVEASPIKGTRPRYSRPDEDRRAANDLLQSAKDRAENLMIVDLLRNDLGRSCVPGSIHVDRLFDLQSFPTVHHLVSTISGELMADRNAWDLLRDSFPGGSITGAPKRRAMEIIAELEPHPRQVYCGSMLYVSADGRMDSSIAIRTLLCRNGEIHCWAGGGIVADSQCDQEYQETFDKVGKFLRVLEKMER